jgi:hypothetical protein
MRVQIPAYTDRWMMGDRYGEVVKTIPANRDRGELLDTCDVRLDKSGKVRRYIADECTMVD